MGSKFKINDKWEEHEQHITCEYGFNQFSISNFMIRMKDCLLEKGYTRILDLENNIDVIAVDLSDEGENHENIKKKYVAYFSFTTNNYFGNTAHN